MQISKDQLRDALSGGAQRLGIPDILDRSFWDRIDAPLRTRVMTDAGPEFGTPWPHPLLSQFASYFRDGNRTRYENQVGARARRLTRAVLMAAITDDTAWLDESADGIALGCEQTGWAWAAHDDVFRARGEVVPADDAPFVDLGAGELASQLAWADHILGPRLDERVPGLRARIRQQVEWRVFTPFLTRRDWHWLGLDGDVHNWNPWIHGNIIAAALLLADNADEQVELIALALEGIDRYVATLPADGATDEGFAYWWNGACRAIEALELVRKATGGLFDASAVPPLVATVSFPHRMHLGGANYLNVADGPAEARGNEPWHVPFGWARRVGDTDAEGHAIAQRRAHGAAADTTEGLGRVLHAIADPDWVAARPAQPPLVARSWLPSIQVMLVREHTGTAAGLTLAMKGGHNAEHHNHLDVGSVVVALDGSPLLVDAGKTTYTAETFGPHRYELRAMQSAWHSVPTPFGLEQGVGREYRAEVVDIADDGLTLELAGAYPLEAGASWRRTARLIRAASTVMIRDEWTLVTGAHDRPAGCVRYLIAGTTTRVGDALLEVPARGGPLMLEWDRPEASATVDVWELDDPELIGVWGPRLSRLTLAMPVARGSLTLTARRKS